MIAILDTTRSAVVVPAEGRVSGGVSVLGLTDGADALRIISREAAKPRSREAAKPRSREAAKPRSREAAKPRSREAAHLRLHGWLDGWPGVPLSA